MFKLKSIAEDGLSFTVERGGDVRSYSIDKARTKFSLNGKSAAVTELRAGDDVAIESFGGVIHSVAAVRK